MIKIVNFLYKILLHEIVSIFKALHWKRIQGLKKGRNSKGVMKNDVALTDKKELFRSFKKILKLSYNK